MISRRSVARGSVFMFFVIATARRLLFCADLFRSVALASHLPPRFLNTSQDELYRSVRKVMGMELDGLLPNHADIAPPAVHLARLRKLAGRKGLF